MRINRNLLADLEKVYNSIKCVTEDNSFCVDCDYCKNERLCEEVYNLLSSIEKFY